MLQLQSLRKNYGASIILNDISFALNDGEHVGLIGPNGTGKTTLLRCITGRLAPDAGRVILAPGLRIGYLAQELPHQKEASVATVLAAAQADHAAAEAELHRLSDAMAATTDLEHTLATYDAALARFEALGGYARSQRAVAVLDGLGLADIEAERPLDRLSGGQKTRLGLATLLLAEPDLLLLDEPTNHLDLEALEWLEHFVGAYPRAVLLVSHDREFLDRSVSRILYLDPETRSLRDYAGNYRYFAAERLREQARQQEAWTRQQQYIGQVRSDIGRLKQQALNVEARSTPKNEPEARFFLDQRGGSKKVAAKAQARERKLERYLASAERVEKPATRWSMKLDFAPPPPGGRAVLRSQELCFAYPGQEPLFVDAALELWHGDRVVLLGPNGSGKSTLLRLINGNLMPQRGELYLGANIRAGWLAQEHETLDPRRSVLDHVLDARPMSTTAARTFLHQFLFDGDSVFRPAAACSPGERSRLQLALLVLQGCNLLLLDEPLNHLDIESREHFAAALAAYSGTVVVVTHDRAFQKAFGQRFIAIRNRHLEEHSA